MRDVNGKEILVSVIIPTYNRKDVLKKVIESVQVQTLSDIEIIVCDDGSTDGTGDMVNTLSTADNRIIYVNCGHNGRPAIPRNVGISKARGVWLAFCDDDDFWNPTKLEVQLFELKKHEMLACSTNAFRLRDGINSGIKYHQINKEKVIGVGDLLACNQIICSSMVINKSLIKQCIGFPEDENLKAIEDYALWMRVACYAPILYMPHTLVEYSENSSDSIRRMGEQTFSVQKRMVLSNLECWLVNQPEKCGRNYKVGIRVFYLNEIKRKTVTRVINDGKTIVKKALQRK